MEMIDVTSRMIGGNDLIPHIKESIKKMNYVRHDDAVKFFKKSLKILQSKRIPTLKIVDKNTTGLTDRKWDALVYMEGTPDKTGVGAAGGSYGIGKNAPYVASQLKMVGYSTRYLNRNRYEKFIARCQLVTHRDPKNNRHDLQNVGFGTSNELRDSRFQPIMGNDIDKSFRLDSQGSGIFIIGFMEQGWEKAAIKSVARNFFSAIHDKKLRVIVGSKTISHETLNEIDFDDVNRRHYYDIIKSPDGGWEKIEGKFGRFTLKAVTGDDDMDNRVAYINRRGMMITDEKSRRKNPFHPRLGDIGNFMAVICAEDDRTDERIRKMEPPTHETIEFERIADPNERKSTDQLLKILGDKVRDHIQKILEIGNDGNQTNLTELQDILPLFDDEDLPDSIPDEIKHKKRQLPKQKPKPVREGDGGGGQAGDGSGAESADGSDGGHDGGNDGRQHINDGITNISNRRIIKSENTLRVAFTPKSGSIRFMIKPAGEEAYDEDAVRLHDVRNVFPSDGVSVSLDNNIVEINTAPDRRIILDVVTDKGAAYPGYDIVECAMGGTVER